MGEVHLDTDVLINILEKYDPKHIVELMVKYDFVVSSIVYYEFCIGVYRAGKEYLKELLSRYITIAPFTLEVADTAAYIQAQLMKEGRPMDHRDLIIGASAIVNNAELWTNNIKHFKRLEEFGLKIFRAPQK